MDSEEIWSTTPSRGGEGYEHLHFWVGWLTDSVTHRPPASPQNEPSSETATAEPEEGKAWTSGAN